MRSINNLRKAQTKYYTELLKDGEIVLLSSCDEYFKSHYLGSPLNVLTNFSGSAAEAIIDKSGKITIFVDTRYHILVDKQVFSNIEVEKMPLGESFVAAFCSKYKKNTILHVYDNILFKTYLDLDKHFDLRTYKLDEKFCKNLEINESFKPFLVDKKIEINDFKYKVERYKKLSSNINKTVIFNLDEISYFTNLRCFKNAYSSNNKAILYLDFKTSNYILFVQDVELIEKFKIADLKIKSLNKFNQFISSMNDEIYINFEDISLKNFLAIKKPMQIKKDNLSVISTIKSKTCIEHLKEAFKKTDLAILNFKKQLKEGLSEQDLVKIFENELKKAGSYATSFKTLLAINENSASIHYSSYDKNKILKNESILLLDCGGYYEGGYATDITRTFYFGKNPKPIHKKVYTYVLKAFIACYTSKNTNAFELDKMAREILKPMYKDGFNFNHGLGHGIGTSVHQNPPVLSTLSKDIIKPYQTHSIEPGLYGKSISSDEEFGVRIENCIYSDINFNKISLSKFPFEDTLIDNNMLNINEIEFIKNWQKEFDL